MSTAEIPAQTLDPIGVAAGVKRFRADMAGIAVRGFDWPLLGAAVGLVCCSLIVLNGATRDDIPGAPDYFVLRQSIFAAIGLGLMLVISRIDYSHLREWRTQLYGFLIGSILLVVLLGTASRGSNRWIDLGFFQLQPSELGKAILVVVLAAHVADRSRDRNNSRVTLAVLALAALPAVLVFMQPDLGTALVYGVFALAILFIGGVPWQHMAVILGVIVALATILLWAAPAANVNVLHGYQVDRLTAFLHPNDDPSGQGYQQSQAQIAIGAGQRTGRGTEDATQTQLNFLPEHHTDFVFAVIGEVFGFAGAATVLTLYALLLWRALRILSGARDQFGALIAAGVVAIFMFQIFVNVGMNVGIMPITGVTLPMVSYGGSSMLVTFILLGLLEAVAVQSRGPRVAVSP